MKRHIKKVAVLGSGVMGSRIACHFANIGLEVVLLDIPPKELNDKESAKGMTLDHPLVRNRIANDNLSFTLKSNPAPLYSKSFAKRIKTGNFEDHMSWLKDCDWIIEVVVERLDIKKIVFDQVEQHRTPGTLITSNTSGIPIKSMLEGRSADFKKHFCGSHFFNPPRYLKLLEIIPTSETDQSVVDFLMDYGSKFLGKTTVLAKDTPAFIANRIGVFGIQAIFHLTQEMGLTIEEVDKLTGPVLGRPKSATYRTADVVGLDTLALVAKGVKHNCPNDERNALFSEPEFITKMIENKWLGSKTKQGFFKKIKGENGKSEILTLDLNTLEYRAKEKAKFATLEMTKSVDDLQKRVPMLYNGMDKAGEFYKKSCHLLFSYVSHRIPEVTDELYKIDDAMRAGFGWEMGPFEMWDSIGVSLILEKSDETIHSWVKESVDAGMEGFYKLENGKKLFWDISSKSYKIIPGQEDKISLSNLVGEKVLWKNTGATIKDLGDGILNVEFHTKMNTIGGDILTGINKAIDMAEADYKGVVLSNEGQNFSAGANVGMIFMMAVEQEFDELDYAVRAFQNTTMRLRYSSVPVVVAPHGLTLGGGCEICLHADKVVANAETYMGLVEFGVGVIPGGGGTKEFTKRLASDLNDGDIRTNQMRNRFLTIGQAKVSTSGEEAFELGYLRRGTDEIAVSRDHQISQAKAACLKMANDGYSMPAKDKFKVLGKEALGIVYVGADSMHEGKYISEHDKLISEKLGYVMCGGDLSQITEVSEQYVLDIERKAFIELCMERKTLERMQSLIQTGKILRN